MSGHSLTLHNIEDELYQLAVDEAGRRELSLNKTILGWARKGAGVTKRKKKSDLSEFFGMWTKKEADEFDKIIEETSERIDPEDWK